MLIWATTSTVLLLVLLLLYTTTVQYGIVNTTALYSVKSAVQTLHVTTAVLREAENA